MKKKKSLTRAFLLVILIIGGICVLIQVAVRVAIDASFIWESREELVFFYPERVPARDAVSEDFTPLWNKKTGNGSEHRGYMQIFDPNDNSIIYITPNSMNSIDLSTGATLWTTNIPEDSTFHFYDDKIFTINSYDDKVPFASSANISIPPNCNSNDRSTLRVYDPHSGQKKWEYSYQLGFSDRIFFNDNSALVDGLTVGLFGKYISTFDIDINSGQVLGVECRNFNDYSRISTEDGILFSGFYPITRYWEWNMESDQPTFIVEGSKLIRVDRQTKNPISQIEFTGFPLNPMDTQLMINGNILVVYLNDSNQFFAFQIK